MQSVAHFDLAKSFISHSLPPSTYRAPALQSFNSDTLFRFSQSPETATLNRDKALQFCSSKKNHMTHRPAKPEPSTISHRSTQHKSSQIKSAGNHNNPLLTIEEMAGSNTILHIIEILGVFVCAHHFWPKGITYGDADDWEVAHRKRQGHGSKSNKSKSRNGSSTHGSSSSDGVKRERSVRDDRRRDRDYEVRRHSRVESSRY